jgi:hypothetical protein
MYRLGPSGFFTGSSWRSELLLMFVTLRISDGYCYRRLAISICACVVQSFDVRSNYPALFMLLSPFNIDLMAVAKLRTASVQSTTGLSSTNHLSLCKLRPRVLFTSPVEQLGLERLIRSRMNCWLENPSRKEKDLTGIGMKATQFPILMRKSRNLPEEK